MYISENSSQYWNWFIIFCKSVTIPYLAALHFSSWHKASSSLMTAPSNFSSPTWSMCLRYLSSLYLLKVDRNWHSGYSYQVCGWFEEVQEGCEVNQRIIQFQKLTSSSCPKHKYSAKMSEVSEVQPLGVFLLDPSSNHGENYINHQKKLPMVI